MECTSRSPAHRQARQHLPRSGAFLGKPKHPCSGRGRTSDRPARNGEPCGGGHPRCPSGLPQRPSARGEEVDGIAAKRGGLDLGRLERPSLGRVAFARQPIQSAIIQCPVGSLTKRTLPKRHSSSLGRGTDERPAGGRLVFEHQSLGRVAFVRQPIQSAIIQCSVGSLAKRTLPKRCDFKL